MKLYGFPPSPNTWQLRALASYLGLPLEFEFVDLTKGGAQTPAFLAINPTARTPALVDGDFKLWETMAIMQYIAGKKPNAAWPNDARTRADITRWQSWSLAHWNRDAWAPVLFERVVKKFMNLGAPDQAAVAKGVAAYEKEAKMLDAHLTKQKYLVGDALTIADFAVASTAVLRQRSRIAARALFAHPRLVRTRVGAAVLARYRAANGGGSVNGNH